MSRILAIDYGGKRCGMAWTDPLRISTNPLDTVSTADFEKILLSYINSGDVSDVVFGLAKHADGNLTKIGSKVIEIIDKLKLRFPAINFHYIDEAFTSQRASQLMVTLGTKKKKRRQKETVDQMSAVLILRDFLETI